MCRLLLVENYPLSLLALRNKHSPIQGLCTSWIHCFSNQIMKNLILTMRSPSCIPWWNLPILLMDANWFDTVLIKLQHVGGRGVGISFVLMARWCAKLMKVILPLILLERLMLVISMQKRKSQKFHSKVSRLYEFIYSVNSFVQWTHIICFSFVTSNCLLHEFNCFCLLYEFFCARLYELLGVDTMAPKEAKKRMKASEDKKRKLLQISSGPTPRKTVSHRAPSIG